jgi:hypothetical protein
VGGNPIGRVDPDGLFDRRVLGRMISPFRGAPQAIQAAVPDYVQVGFTAPGYGGSITVDRNFRLYVGLQTGTITPLLSGQACFGKVRGPRRLTPDELSGFLAGPGGQLSLGQYGLGLGFAFSDNRTAVQYSFGTPQLPSGGGGYSWQVLPLPGP